MLEALPRRAFLGHLASAPAWGAGVLALSVQPVDAAAADVLAQIDQAERQCRKTKQAFDEAVAAYEAALPRLHPALNLTEQEPWRYQASIERRHFDNAKVKRYVNRYGYQDYRYIVTAETLSQDLADCPYADRRRRKEIRRMLRRATRYEAAISEAEEAFDLAALAAAHDEAQHAMEELTSTIFERPAVTMAAVQAQARMLCAYTSSIIEQDVTCQAGHFGAQLAANLQTLAEAT